MWNQIDFNGNSYVSLAEVDKGLKEVIQSQAIYDAKPAIIRAFNFAKEYTKGTS